MKTKVFLIMMFVMAGFVVPGWAEFRTVGVYDPGADLNDADQACVYSSSTGNAGPDNVITWAQFPDFQADVLAAYNANMGGVVDVEVADFGGERGWDNIDTFEGDDIIRARYGVAWETGTGKKLDIVGSLWNISVGDGESSDLETPISGGIHGGRFGMKTSLGYHFVMGNIVGGLEGEKVIEFGLTMLEEINDPAGIWATATFSDGSSVTSQASVGDSTPNDQDTFCGFRAPVGEYIVTVQVTTPGYWGNMDDIGFITSSSGFKPASNAGPDQLGVQLWDATGANASPGVVLAGSVALPDTITPETYTYTWSGGFDTITDNASETATTPTVTFTAIGNYTLTLNVWGDVNGDLYSDTVTIIVIQSTSNAGPNQTVTTAEAVAGVTLAGSVNNPYPAEDYTYTWTGGFAGGTTTGAAPVVTFTAIGDYIVTVVANGNVQGDLASDTVRIRVVKPVLDAGFDVSVEKTIAAYPGVYLDSTIIDPNGSETYTYAWSSMPVWTSITNAAEADPVVTYPAGVFQYTLTLIVTGTEGADLVDTVIVNVTDDHVMVAHFALDSGELAAGHYADSSTEGDPNNHFFITETVGDSGNHDGVVDCGDDKAIKNSNKAPLRVHLDYSEPNDTAFNYAAPHLDNIDASITVALWIMNDYGERVWAIEKEGTFAFGIDDNGDLRTKLWFVGEGDPNLIKSKDGNGLGDDLHDEGLKINADGAGGGHEHVWHHIAFTYDSFTGYVEQFLDGALIREEYVGRGQLLTVGTTSLFIGKNVTDFGQGVEGLRGAIDDIRIYNYPLEYSEIAGLASMAEAATLVYAGADVTIDPNEMPYRLSGRFIRLGQGVNEVSRGSNDPNVWDDVNNTDRDYYVRWEPADGNDLIVFSDTGDPESDVTLPAPGAYTLRLVSYERLCNKDNEIRSEMTITVGFVKDCAGFIAFGGAATADVAGNDCVVSVADLAALARTWLLVIPGE